MTDTPAPTIKATPWQTLKDYLGAQIDADDEVRRGFLESGDRLRAASFGGLLAANRSTLAKVAELEAAATGCRVADQIIPWPEVQEGDLVVWDGEFRLITCLIDYGGEPLMWFDGSKTGPGVLPCGTYAAVRRYVEG